MSDSDSDSDCCSGGDEPTDCTSWSDIGLPKIYPDENLDKWCLIPVKTKKAAAQRMKVCAFWFPMLLQREECSEIAHWAIENGLISSDSKEDLSSSNLRMIQAMECLLRALEKASFKKDLTRRIILFSNRFHRDILDDFGEVLHYFNQIEPGKESEIAESLAELRPYPICCSILQLLFTEFAKFIHEMGQNLKRTLKTLEHRPPDCHIQRSEVMKRKGNESFQMKKYEEAVTFYSEAIKYYPDNHILYGNRSLCYIRSGKFEKAAGDGRCATLIDPMWAKGHYRYCEALFNMGESTMALKANALARSLCKDDVEGMKDLNQQHVKFSIETEATGYGWVKEAADRGFYLQNFVRLSGTPPPRTNATKKAAKVPEVKVEKKPAKTVPTAPKENTSKEPKPAKSEFSLKNAKVESKNAKAESNNATKRKAKNRKNPAEEKKEAGSKVAVCKELRSFVQDAHTALVDQRSRNAEQAFSQALTLLDTTPPKELGLSTLDVLLLMFGRASALTDIGQPQELTEAQKVLKKIRSYEERTFQCLVFYAVGRVYLRENRFSAAVEQFSDSMQMVKNQITPGKLTWPLTKEIVRETQPDYFKEVLESALESCKYPPPPDAICRLEKCMYSVKAEIYFTDPDFKGFIQMCCCQSCTVEYHMTCWKSLKTSVYNEKNEKDFLQEPCLTPDCVGLICSIKIFGPTGLVKCKFETAVLKPQTAKKPKVNQKCTSLKNLKSKEERKARRKAHKQAFQEKQALNDESLQQKDDSACQSPPKVWQQYRDRVLLQVKQNLELLSREWGFQVSALMRSLKPWLELDASRGNQTAAELLKREPDATLTLGEAVELLLERKNRVWARILVQQLSSCMDIQPKLYSWAFHLDDAGLTAARTFIERHAEHLEQLDLALLFTFGPLQDMIIEKLGTRPELFSSMGLTVTECLKQAPPQDMRLFIWTLEEHREHYVSCHTILDDYFDMMDGHCSVLKKSDENENNSPMKTKNRGRKKKRRERIIQTTTATQEDWNQDFFEDDSLAFLHPVDSFSVPNHLREAVADFEEQYSRTRHRTHFQNLLDNNPDPAKETLYEYFAQILDQHGAMMADDPLLVGELENFPIVSRQWIKECGGFEAFLLGSQRFVKVGPCVGLTKHALLLQPAGPGASLDDLDDFTDSNEGAPYPDFQMNVDPNFTTNGMLVTAFYPAPQPEVYPILPNPYAPEFQPAAANAFPPWSNGNQNQAGYYAPYQYEELDLYTSEVLGETWDENLPVGDAAPATAEKNPSKADAAVQTQLCEENMRSVSVNTEIHKKFESCPGDISKKEKSNMQLEKEIQKMESESDRVDVPKPEDIVSLEGEVQQITANIQVTNQELLLFQQKLEEEVKKDQKEKKAHQEALKSLKQETEALVEEQGSLTRSIREKKASYDAKLRDFLDLSNQSATERMSLEDELKRCKALLSSATQRSLTTQLLVAESSRDQGLNGVRRELVDAKALLAKLDEVLQHRPPNQELELARSSCSAVVEELKKKISASEQQYQEQINQVKSGRRVSDLPPVNLPSKTEPAAAPLSPAVHRPAQASRSTPPPAAAAAEASRSLNSPSSLTKFERTMESLTNMFPEYSRVELMRFVQELRASSGGSLSSMALQDVIAGVTQLILDHQERRGAARSIAAGRSSPAQSRTPPPLTPAWQAVSSQKPPCAKALNMEDPCIICHDDMSPADTCVLECRHSFHSKCIRLWLRGQSTCPTCRTHALLPEDFPALTGRRRQAP